MYPQNKRLINFCCIAVILFPFSAGFDNLAAQSLSASTAELKDEVADWHRKIKDLKSKIKKQKDETAHDKETFGAYRKRNGSYRDGLSAQTDSLKAYHQLIKVQTDSLEVSVNGAHQDIQNYRLQREYLRKTLIEMCRSLENLIGDLPPGNIQANVSAVDFLRGELETNSVTESEAIERLWQVLFTLDEASRVVDVYAAPSPIPEITGRVWFIRFGFVYSAIVQEGGDAGALWVSNRANPDGYWKIEEDKNSLLDLWKAVQVHERQTVPQLVGIPFDHEIGLDTLPEFETR